MELLRPLTKDDFPAKTTTFDHTGHHDTASWNAGPQGVLVWADQPCYVEVGESAVANTSSTPIPAFTPIPFALPANVSGEWQVSFRGILNAVTGNGYCKPINRQ